MTTSEILYQAKKAKKALALLGTEEKNKALFAMADSIAASSDDILLKNRMDVEKAKGSISEVMLDRLMLNEARILAMADGIRAESFPFLSRVVQRSFLVITINIPDGTAGNIWM